MCATGLEPKAEAGLVDHDATDLLSLCDHKLGVGEMGECTVTVDDLPVDEHRARVAAAAGRHEARVSGCATPRSRVEKFFEETSFLWCRR
jgi:hypothetical protein